jgi:hypothetical protein
MRFSTDALFSMSVKSFAYSTASNTCMWSVAKISGSQVIVGQPFIGQYYSVFHVEGQQLGFGVSSTRVNPQVNGPWITGYIYPPTPEMYDFQLNSVQSYIYVIDAYFGNPAQAGQLLIANDQ